MYLDRMSVSNMYIDVAYKCLAVPPGSIQSSCQFWMHLHTTANLISQNKYMYRIHSNRRSCPDRRSPPASSSSHKNW